MPSPGPDKSPWQKMTRIYDLEKEVIKEILRVDRAMSRHHMDHGVRPQQFAPFWARWFELTRESIGAYGGH